MPEQLPAGWTDWRGPANFDWMRAYALHRVAPAPIQPAPTPTPPAPGPTTPPPAPPAAQLFNQPRWRKDDPDAEQPTTGCASFGASSQCLRRTTRHPDGRRTFEEFCASPAIATRILADRCYQGEGGEQYSYERGTCTTLSSRLSVLWRVPQMPVCQTAPREPRAVQWPSPTSPTQTQPTPYPSSPIPAPPPGPPPEEEPSWCPARVKRTLYPSGKVVYEESRCYEVTRKCPIGAMAKPVVIMCLTKQKASALAGVGAKVKAVDRSLCRGGEPIVDPMIDYDFVTCRK